MVATVYIVTVPKLALPSSQKKKKIKEIKGYFPVNIIYKNWPAHHLDEPVYESTNIVLSGRGASGRKKKYQLWKQNKTHLNIL